MERADYEKQKELLQAQANRMGYKVLLAWQCIKCGQIFNDVDDLSDHLYFIHGNALFKR